MQRCSTLPILVMPSLLADDRETLEQGAAFTSPGRSPAFESDLRSTTAAAPVRAAAVLSMNGRSFSVHNLQGRIYRFYQITVYLEPRCISVYVHRPARCILCKKPLSNCSRHRMLPLPQCAITVALARRELCIVACSCMQRALTTSARQQPVASAVMLEAIGQLCIPPSFVQRIPARIIWPLLLRFVLPCIDS